MLFICILQINFFEIKPFLTVGFRNCKRRFFDGDKGCSIVDAEDRSCFCIKWDHKSILFLVMQDGEKHIAASCSRTPAT